MIHFVQEHFHRNQLREAALLQDGICRRHFSDELLRKCAVADQADDALAHVILQPLRLPVELFAQGRNRNAVAAIHDVAKIGSFRPLALADKTNFAHKLLSLAAVEHSQLVYGAVSVAPILFRHFAHSRHNTET